MATKIIYIHPGDMVEVRICSTEYPATATDWRQQTRPGSITVRFPDGGIEVFDAVTNMVWGGTGPSRRQMLVRPEY